MGKGQKSFIQYSPAPKSSADINQIKKSRVTVIYDQPHQKPTINMEEAPMLNLLTTYLSYLILILIGHIKDFILHILVPAKVFILIS